MTQTLQESLGEAPSGRVFPFSTDDMTEFLRRNYLSNDAEHARMERMRLRLELYRDRGEEQIKSIITKVFSDPKNIALREAFIPYARFQNVTKRVINEISTVYSERAQRKVKGGDKSYQQLLRMLNQDRKLRKVNRLTNLLNEVMVMFRVSAVDMQPTLDIITPDMFYAVGHPLDPTKLVAIIFQSVPQGKQVQTTDPHFTVWSAAETFRLDAMGRMVNGTHKAHDYGRIPGVLVHRDIPDSRLLDPDSGEDLTSAHKAIALLNVLMLKEQKSGTKVPYTTGDTGETAMGQSLDTENLLHLEEGMQPGTLDLGADPRTYIDAVRSVIKQVAANYQIPESVFDLSYQASSGFEIELKRVGLREKRRDQIMDFRDVERELVDVESTVVSSDLTELAFKTDGWQVDFGEVEAPQDPSQRLAYWKEMRTLGLMTTIDMAMELNPEFNEKQAADWVSRNIELETERVMQMKQMAQVNGSAGSEVGEPTAEENGAAGREAAQGDEQQPEA